MSDHSDKFNGLPFEQRVMLGAMLTEAEIRIIEVEKKRLRAECDKAISAHDERIKCMRAHLDQMAKQVAGVEQ